MSQYDGQYDGQYDVMLVKYVAAYFPEILVVLINEVCLLDGIHHDAPTL